MRGLLACGDIDFGNGDPGALARKRIAVARPIPLPPPVMKATLPASRAIASSSPITTQKQPEAGRPP